MLYKQVVCNMSMNPAFAANVAERATRMYFSRYMQRQVGSEQPSLLTTLYTVAYRQDAGSSMSIAWDEKAGDAWTGSQALKRRAGAGPAGQGPWYLRVKRAKGDNEAQDLLVNLPSPFPFDSQRIVYGPQMASVKTYKDLTLQRLLYLRLGEVAPGSKFKALRRQTLFSNPNPLGVAPLGSAKLY